MKTLTHLSPLKTMLLSFALVVLPVAAEESARRAPELLSRTQIVQWLADDPALKRAIAQKQRRDAEAAQIANSGYEWTASYSRQQRKYDQPELAGMDRSREWTLELERSVRLPGKGAASRDQAKALRDLASVTEQAERREAVEALIDAYLDALHASANLALLQQERVVADTNLRAVEQRVKAGDAPALDARLAAAESQALARELHGLQQAAAANWARFSHRYPAATLPPFATNPASPDEKSIQQILDAIPEPRLIDGSDEDWHKRLLEHQPALRQAEASLNAARAAADKARRDRIPDPSIAIYNGRESFGDENIVGLRLSMPIPGNQRRQALRQSLADEASLRAEREILRRSLAAEAENQVRRARSEFQRWQLARQMADTFAENARLLQKAYRLGEQDLQGLLLGQQQQVRAAVAEVESRVEALRAHYQLRLAAGELNPFAPAAIAD